MKRRIRTHQGWRDPHGPAGSPRLWPALLAAAGLLIWPAGAWAGDPGRVGAAFGEEPGARRADPFPPEAFQEALPGACPALLDHRIADLRGRTINLCAFSGKVLLVVNTASR
jgi:hypothetical protein